MLTMLLAIALSSPHVTRAEDILVSAIYANQGARAERAAIASWLAEQDATLEAHRQGRKPSPELAELVVTPVPTPVQVSPFALSDDFDPFVDSDRKPAPDFDAEPRLVWWQTTEIRSDKW